MAKLKVGVLGCGQISKIYLKNLTGMFADRVEVVGVADVLPDAAKTRAGEYGIARHGPPETLLNDPDVQLLLNLTPAPNHFDVSTGVIAAGKHLYSEKPLALSMDQGRQIIDAAAKKGLRVSVAPDTLLGAGVQTCRKAIESGAIGDPVAAHGFVSIGIRGERYFNVFRGPLLDLGPYHVGALLTMLGPVRAVVGRVQPKRQVPEAPLPPSAMTDDNPGNAATVLEFESGCLATLICTAEFGAYAPALKVWGATGALTCPDPNGFGGKVELAPANKPAEEVPHAFGYADNARGIGVWDMAGAIAEGRPHRLGADLALHALEVMLSAIDSSKAGRRVELSTRFAPTPPMPASA